MRNRLFYKTFGTYFVIIVLAVAVFYILVGQQIRTSAIERAEEELSSYARIMELSPRKDLEDRIDTFSQISRARITLIDTDGTVLADSEKEPATMESHLNRPEIQEARVKGKGSAIRFSQSLDVDMIYVAIPIHKGLQGGGYVRLARPLYDVRSSADKLYRSLIKSILFMIVPSLLAAIVFAYRLTSPIRQMERFTERLRTGYSQGTLQIRSQGEMRQLADNINYLVIELQNRIRTANEEKEKLVAAFASMAEGVLVLDQENRIESSNRAFRKMIVPQHGDIIGKTLIEAFRNIDLQNAFDSFKATGEPHSAEITIEEAAPVSINVSISKIQGVEEKALIVFHDVTRLKRLEKMRVDFVANVTHEIKTPLTAILGFVETLRKGALEDRETAMRFLEIIDRHSKRLNRLVEDLITISNIELGETKLFMESVSLSGIAESVLSLIAYRAGEKKIQVEKNIPEDLPPIRADRDRLVQILLNVLDNAVKFTPEGGRICLAAALRPEGYVAVTLSDTGIGIPRDEISRLGERFYRVDKTRSRELGGTGLGLSIVKHLVKAHDGRMEIQSRLGQGTTVSLLLPVYREETV